jgi:hypothetical protein
MITTRSPGCGLFHTLLSFILAEYGNDLEMNPSQSASRLRKILASVPETKPANCPFEISNSSCQPLTTMQGLLGSGQQSSAVLDHRPLPFVESTGSAQIDSAENAIRRVARIRISLY